MRFKVFYRCLRVCLFLLLASCTSLPPTLTVKPEIERPTEADGSTAAPTPTPAPTATRSPAPTQTGDGHADVIFHGGQVLTMNQDLEQAEALAVLGNKIARVGAEEDVLALEGPSTRVIDLEGRALMPGFVDAHTHIFNEGGNFAADQQVAIENGITTLGNAWADADFVRAMQEFEASGKLNVRTSLYLAYSTACGDIVGDWYREFSPTRKWGEMLRIGGVKMYADGGSCGVPAFSEEAGLDPGDLWMTADEMAPVIREAQGLDYQVVIHALGDRAIEHTLDAFEMALDGAPNVHRHRIDHNSVVRPELMPRYAEIGVVPVIFGTYFIGDSCPGTSELAPHAQDWDWPYRELMEENPDLTFAWHGDDPFVGPVSPLLELFSMTTPFEVSRDGNTICDTPDRLKDRSLTPREALPLMTTGSAYALFREDEVGQLKKGFLADMIVVDGNPLAVPPREIKDLNVQMTMIDGEILYCTSAFCRPELGQQGQVFSSRGVVPEGATHANLGLRIQMECSDCSGPGKLSVFQFDFTAGGEGVDIPNAGFERGLQSWGMWGTGKEAAAIEPGPAGQRLVLDLESGQELGLNSETFPVSPGERYHFQVEADIVPGSGESGYFAVFFLEEDAEVSRVRIPFGSSQD